MSAMQSAPVRNTSLYCQYFWVEPLIFKVKASDFSIVFNEMLHWITSLTGIHLGWPPDLKTHLLIRIMEALYFYAQKTVKTYSNNIFIFKAKVAVQLLMLTSEQPAVTYCMLQHHREMMVYG